MQIGPKRPVWTLRGDYVMIQPRYRAHVAPQTRGAAATNTAVTTHPYAPFGIVDDPAAFGLVTSVVETTVGPVTVRHTPAPPAGATALVLLHGAAGSWSTWTPLLQAAAHRAAAAPSADPFIHLVIPDLPGWGASPLPANPADRTIEAISAAVAECTRALGFERFTLLGHSLGGFVALDLASREPDATDRLLLVSPTTFAVIDAVRRPLGRTLPAYSGMLLLMRTLAALRGTGTALITSMSGTRLFRMTMAPLFAHPAQIDPTVLRALATEARPRSFALASARAGAYDPEQQWMLIRPPAATLSGDRDVFVAPTDAARLAALIPTLTTGILPGAGHFGHLERPFDVLDAFFPPTTTGDDAR